MSHPPFMTVERIPDATLEQFAARHDLTLEVKERRTALDSPMRFFASFKGTEVKGDRVLTGVYGDGNTPDAAAADYAKSISLTRIVVDAMTKNRREIDVPRLTHAAPSSRQASLGSPLKDLEESVNG